MAIPDPQMNPPTGAPDEEVGPAGITPPGSPPAVSANRATPEGDIGEEVGPSGISPGGTGRRNYQSWQEGRTGIGLNIAKALERGFIGAGQEIAGLGLRLPVAPLGLGTPEAKALAQQISSPEAIRGLQQKLGLEAPTQAQDPARYREEDPYPVGSEILSGLEHSAGEFVGGFLFPTPLPEFKVGERVAGLGTAGMRTGWKWLQKVEASLAKVPGGAAITESVRDMNVKYADNTVEIISRMTGGRAVSAGIAGQAIKEQVEKRAGAMRVEGDHLYGEVDRLVPGDTQVHVPNTLKTLEDLGTAEQKFAEDPLTGRPSLQDIPAEVSQAATKGLGQFRHWYDSLRRDIDEFGVIPYETIKRFRTEVGQEVDRGVFASMPNAKMSRLYAAISDDMMNTAQLVGPEAFAAVQRANSTWRDIKAEQEVLADVLKKHGGPENVFKSLIATGVRTKWGGGATVIRSVLGAVDEDTHRLISASVLHELGRATNGLQETVRGDTFNAATFLTNWSSLSDEAKSALFHELPGNYNLEVDRLARNVEALKAYGRLIPNPSGTAAAWWSASELTGFIASLVTGHFGVAGGIATTYVATKVAANALTNPATVRYLANKTAGLLVAAAKSTSAIRAQPDELPEEQQPQPNYSDLTE